MKFNKFLLFSLLAASFAQVMPAIQLQSMNDTSTGRGVATTWPTSSASDVYNTPVILGGNPSAYTPKWLPQDSQAPESQAPVVGGYVNSPGYKALQARNAKLVKPGHVVMSSKAAVKSAEKLTATVDAYIPEDKQLYVTEQERSKIKEVAKQVELNTKGTRDKLLKAMDHAKSKNEKHALREAQRPVAIAQHKAEALTSLLTASETTTTPFAKIEENAKAAEQAIKEAAEAVKNAVAQTALIEQDAELAREHDNIVGLTNPRRTHA